jgi:hypothetical protein
LTTRHAHAHTRTGRILLLIVHDNKALHAHALSKNDEIVGRALGRGRVVLRNAATENHPTTHIDPAHPLARGGHTQSGASTR